MTAAFCIALFAAGHLVRDGWPPLGSTHAARGLGAALCGIGAACVAPPVLAALVFAAVLAGFYYDKKHAAGQNAKTPEDTDMLVLSGMTSVAPVALLAPWTILAGAAKPFIWEAGWTIVPEGRWLSPTRAAAMVFGALVGAGVSAA